ncbi:ABC transporter substrate-binding protein [Sphingomicrobium clamense]|uniref:ABC transporter substrate-binding protein n=1 Tax=Sphingomicrobium clamense TaxID=2851013 RepID=A0ABS6V4W7_9SPHN|nr:ABC transporter substrate-binding protein [Sphingomicrobium sp. B8]MBW0144599.1 ABC transporter substrate-binding protein [Sphingomicrobium sp. B8]
MRMTATFLALAAPFALAGCTGSGPGETHVTIIADREDSDDVLVSATAQGLVVFDARGQIQPALAESWHVSADGRSYIFRLARGEWPDGTRIVAEDVADALQFALADVPLADALGGVEAVRAMTERVIEVRLVAPRPYLLPLLANPALAIRRDEMGSGPFTIAEPDADNDGATLHLERVLRDRFGEEQGRERVHLTIESASAAIASFVAGNSELVLGGDFTSLPLVREAAVPRGALRYDPVLGLFGLVPLTERAPFDTPEARLILSQAIDRAALIEELGVPALAPRATILQDGLDLARPPVQPDWLADPETARANAAERWRALVGDEPVTLSLALPDGPGAQILQARLAEDWAPLRITIQQTDAASADFAFVDAVAPSPSASWFLRRFSCSRARVCDAEIDALVEAARDAQIIGQRQAILADAGARMDAAALFLPLAAPIRWSLVAPGVTGFSENRYAVHPLTGLKDPLPPETAR